MEINLFVQNDIVKLTPSKKTESIRRILVSYDWGGKIAFAPWGFWDRLKILVSKMNLLSNLAVLGMY